MLIELEWDKNKMISVHSQHDTQRTLPHPDKILNLFCKPSLIFMLLEDQNDHVSCKAVLVNIFAVWGSILSCASANGSPISHHENMPI